MGNELTDPVTTSAVDYFTLLLTFFHSCCQRYCQNLKNKCQMAGDSVHPQSRWVNILEISYKKSHNTFSSVTDNNTHFSLFIYPFKNIITYDSVIPILLQRQATYYMKSLFRKKYACFIQMNHFNYEINHFNHVLNRQDFKKVLIHFLTTKFALKKSLKFIP